MPHRAQERGRQHEAEFKVMPAGKRFRANDMARRQRLLGLEPRLDLAGGQGFFKCVAVKQGGGQQRQRLRQRAIQLFVA
ncbi:hypothetical protein D3C73_1206230 [compost metagenome]